MSTPADEFSELLWRVLHGDHPEDWVEINGDIYCRKCGPLPTPDKGSV